jgi:hypothetical protein
MFVITLTLSFSKIRFASFAYVLIIDLAQMFVFPYLVFTQNIMALKVMEENEKIITIATQDTKSSF